MGWWSHSRGLPSALVARVGSRHHPGMKKPPDPCVGRGCRRVDYISKRDRLLERHGEISGMSVLETLLARAGNCDNFAVGIGVVPVQESALAGCLD